MKIQEYDRYSVVVFGPIRSLILKPGFEPSVKEIDALKARHNALHVGYDVRAKINPETP